MHVRNADIFFVRLHRIFESILSYGEKIMCNMTENLQVYDVQSLLTCFVRCCLKLADFFSVLKCLIHTYSVVISIFLFLSCWFSSAIFRDSSGLRSPQPISRLPLFAFLIQPYSVFTGIWSSFAAFTAPIFLASFTACTLC